MITLRAARPDDAAAIARIHTDTWETTYQGVLPSAYLEAVSHDERLKMWKQTLVHAPQGIFLAEHEELGPMGFVSCGSARDPIEVDSKKFRGEIHALYVRPVCQGMGLGKQLFDTAVGNLVKAGYSAIFVWLFGNSPAIGFFERVGGRPIAQRAEEFEGKELQQVAYGWDGKTQLTQ